MDKTVKMYYKQNQHGGRSVLARVADTAALHIIFVAASYLWFRANVENIVAVIVLAATTSLLFFTAAALWRALRFDRFVKKEEQRLISVVLKERLLLMPADGFQVLCETAAEQTPEANYRTGAANLGCFLYTIRQAQPVGEDGVLKAYRAAQAAYAGRLVLCSLSPLTPAAAALLTRLPMDVAQVRQETLLHAAEETPGYSMDAIDVEAYIMSEMQERAEYRKKLQTQPFAPGNTKKYAICAALLFAASFVTGYALYYRLLAGVCAALATAAALLNRRAPANAVTQAE